MVERVVARDLRYCSSVECPLGDRERGIPGAIMPRQTYAKVFANEGRPKIIKGRAIYSPRDYHFDCVPAPYRPLVRFLHPVPIHKPVSRNR